MKKILLFAPILLILVSCSNESDVNNKNLEKNQLQPQKILEKTPTLFCSGMDNLAIIELDLVEMTVKGKWTNCVSNHCISNHPIIRGAEHGNYYYSQEKIGDMWFNWSFKQEITKELKRYRWRIYNKGTFSLFRKDLSLGVLVFKAADYGDFDMTGATRDDFGSRHISLNCSHQTQESLQIKIDEETKKYEERRDYQRQKVEEEIRKAEEESVI